MTDGLEISEISLMQVKELSYSGRIDSNYFSKKAIEFDEYSAQWMMLSNICPNIKSGTTPTERDDNLDHGIILLKTNDIRNNLLTYSIGQQFYYINDELNSKMLGTMVKNKDILLNIVGATTEVIGRVAFVTDEFPKANITQAMAILRTNDKNYLSEYLFAFLMSSYAKLQTMRIARQTGQYNMNLIEAGSYRIPRLSIYFQTILAKLVNKAISLQNDANKNYGCAETILNECLGLLVLNSCNTFTTKTVSDSFMQSGRIDAEYYQSKYDIYEHTIKKYPNGYTTINEKFDLVSERCLRNLSRYRYIEIGDINVGNGSYTYNVLNTEELPDNAKIMTHLGDILVSTVRPNRGAVAILEEDNLLVSGAFTVLRSKSDYSNEILQLILRTPVYRDWLLKFNVGTSYPVIKDKDVLSLPIPLLEENIQEEISDKMQESVSLRKEAKRLLDNVIQAIERAIETDEETALKQLDKMQLCSR